MGVYLNSHSAYGLFQADFSLTYYVDKSDILKELIPLVEGKAPKYVAITRPRRFGKTVMANMIASYFNKDIDSHEVFDTLNVSQYPWYKKHLNHHNVIHIMFNEIPDEVTSYEQYSRMIKDILLDDLSSAYPNAKIRDTDPVWRALTKVYEYCNQERFIFILDEWDYIYHQSYMTDADKPSDINSIGIFSRTKRYQK